MGRKPTTYFLIAYCGASLLCAQNLDIFNIWEIRQLEASQSVRDNRSYRSKSCPFRVPRCEPVFCDQNRQLLQT